MQINNKRHNKTRTDLCIPGGGKQTSCAAPLAVSCTYKRWLRSPPIVITGGGTSHNSNQFKYVFFVCLKVLCLIPLARLRAWECNVSPPNTLPGCRAPRARGKEPPWAY